MMMSFRDQAVLLDGALGAILENIDDLVLLVGGPAFLKLTASS